MTDLERWQKGNETYLSAALAWLRLRLEKLAASDTPETSAPAKDPTKNDIVQAAAAMDAAMNVEPPPALVLLSQRFGLSRFEQEILLLCAAMELDTRIAALCAHAQDDPNRAYPTFALALTLFDDPAWDALSPERPLRYWQLIEINQPVTRPMITSPLRADERIVNYIKGLNFLDDRLTPLLVPFDAVYGDVELPPSQQEAVTKAVRHLQQSVTVRRSPVIQLVGPDTLSKQLVAQRTAAALGLYLERLPIESLPAQVADLEKLARLWQRESFLLPIALYLDAHEVGDLIQTDNGAQHGAPSLQRFLVRNGVTLFLATREVQPGLGPATIFIEMDKPTPAEQQMAWADVLNGPTDGHPALLAGQFNLNLPTIRQIARTAMAVSSTNGHSVQELLWDTCLLSTRPKLDLLAQRLVPKATWEDIVLPEETDDLLHQIAEQVRQRNTVYDGWGWRAQMNRGLGISALFAGASGTGKTMAAEVIANDLHLNLYRIDLSAVVSKYIGETEKNLRRLFDAAEDGGAILFFDEADALFGKRSEVKDSHDRYANIEINYLLQRMEAYRGLAILATNMKGALDKAFMRRLRFIVNFPFPGLEERRAVWAKIFPPETPTEGLDYDRLARLNLTGGSIHNIALNAAFLAAQAAAPVTMPIVLDAARTELRKLERPVNEADFRWQEARV